MALYLTKFSYTPEAWARLISHGEDRRKAAQTYIEAVGGKLNGFWYAFGCHDGYIVWEAPDNVAMTAVAIAITAGGAVKDYETTVLVTVDDTLEALKKAAQVKYKPPGTA
ncbi:GYD domain-containing protein [Bdellovibrio reynosensis]|uniref:GYD domain-containing protein n=1 Tax=Bdellovibrio reynosensis TaxID=2835041 RepID=A0ABY4C4M6_9BACT|nr:GYD domain-containing protein [Bdellovibrio reynosensis]UOE99807.1 GYD domain-containing protein [Bdellovibrio reynosensis]